ncbi:MAG TPA: universal stress protein [Gammaproteobacteria bacterium]|nr:universal stress protein [Gammaproteobacteria bacterium]
MTVPSQILVVIDPTEGPQPALAHATVLARHTRARLELFICAYDAQLLETQFVNAAALAKARSSFIDGHIQRLRQLARPLQDEGLSVTVDARWDSPLHEGIVRKAIDSQADLVVKDTHYHALIKRSIFSNTDWHLIRDCPMPLWLVKPRAIAARPCFIAAVDPLHDMDKPAELDHSIMSAATELAGATGGEVHVYHAFDITSQLAVSTPLTSPIVLPVKEIIEAVSAQHTAATHELTDRYGVPRDRVHLHQGGTRDGLIALADRVRADVVVMGAVSRRRLSRLFIGNTAEDVLDKIGCDILVVKTPSLAAKLKE